MLTRNPQAVQNFMVGMRSTSFGVCWPTILGIQSWEKHVGGDVGILLQLAITNESDAFAKALVNARPDIVEDGLHSLLGELKYLTARTLGTSLAALADQATLPESFASPSFSQYLKNGTSLMATYLQAYNDSSEHDFLHHYTNVLETALLKSWVRKKKDLSVLAKRIFKSRRLGMLLGVILAGGIKCARRFKSHDECLQKIVHTMSDALFACAGLAAPAAAVGAPFSGLILDYFLKGRDFESVITACQGILHSLLLEQAERKEILGEETTTDASRVLRWFDRTMEVNGLR